MPDNITGGPDELWKIQFQIATLDESIISAFPSLLYTTPLPVNAFNNDIVREHEVQSSIILIINSYSEIIVVRVTTDSLIFFLMTMMESS